MRNPILVAIAGGGLAATVALGAAVPALATGSSPSSASTASSAASTSASTSSSATPNRAPLSRADLVTIDRFFENHPVLGHRLVRRINAWKTFLANHPGFAAKLQEWKALPPAQRRAAEHAWLAKHPVIRHDMRQLRADRRELRRDLRQLSRDLRS
jgi:hemophore-related protein